MYKILLVEDNQEVAGILSDYLEYKGMELDYAANGEQGLQLALQENFDTIILDLMLPRINGLDVCKELRAKGKNTPILMLTALDAKDDMLTGFEHGADDYLTKPFDLTILEARLNALIRRHRGSVTQSRLTFADITIDQKTHKAYREDKMLDLNPSTYTILELLCQRAPDIVTKQEIADVLWPQGEYNTDTLRAHIYQLRNQLDKPFRYAMLKTLPKIGVYLEAKK